MAVVADVDAAAGALPSHRDHSERIGRTGGGDRERPGLRARKVAGVSEHDGRLAVDPGGSRKAQLAVVLAEAAPPSCGTVLNQPCRANQIPVPSGTMTIR